MPVVTSTAPSPPTSSKSFCTVSLTGGDKRNARTEQCEGSERTPQTVTSTLHQINLFYWFPRSPTLCQVTVPWNVPACPGSGAETILTVAGSAVPGGILGCSSCRERENPNLRPHDPPAKTTVLQLQRRAPGGGRWAPAGMGTTQSRGAESRGGERLQRWVRTARGTASANVLISTRREEPAFSEVAFTHPSRGGQ